MKKRIPALLTVAALLLTMSACGGTSNSAASAASASAASSAAGSAAQEEPEAAVEPAAESAEETPAETVSAVEEGSAVEEASAAEEAAAEEEEDDTFSPDPAPSSFGLSFGGKATGKYENRPVYASGVYEMPDEDATEAVFNFYGYYNTTDASVEDCFTLLSFAKGVTAAVYTDSTCAALLEGVTADFDGTALTLTFDSAPEDEVYGYVLFDDGATVFTPVPVYVISAGSQSYLNAETDYNGYTLRYDADAYTPNAVYYEEGTADAIVGGALDLFDADSFQEEIAAAALSTGYDYDALYEAVDYYLNNGSTTGGDTMEEFLTDRVVNVNPTDDTAAVHVGDGYLRVEACYYLFRYYWMNNTTYEVSAGDDITGIFSDNMNKLYPDFSDFFWGHYYCTWFQALNPALRSGGLFRYDSVVDSDGSNTDKNGMYGYRADLGVDGQLPYEIDTAINWGDFLNMIYNAITGGQSALNEAGEAAAEALQASGGDSREANAQAVCDYFGLDIDLDSKLDETVTKWDAVMVFYAMKGTSDAAKELPDDNTEDTYLYNTTKHGSLATDTYLDTDTYYARKGITDYTAETNHYGLTSMAAVTISPASTVDRSEWADCTIYEAGDLLIMVDGTAIITEADIGEDAGTIYYQAGYSATDYQTAKTYYDLAFSYQLEDDGSLTVSGVDGYCSFATGTSWDSADVGAFYCSGLWIRDGAKVQLSNTTVLAQASASGDDINDDSHRFFGGGDGLQVTDADTAVTVKNTNGQIFLVGTGSTAAGSLYLGGGSTTVVKGTTLRNASGHPYSIFYNGNFVLDRCTSLNSGRIFNSDASSGTVIFNDTIAVEDSGAAVEDETCSAYFVNTFATKFSGWEMNGNSQAVYTNCTVENGGAWNFANKTSMSSDVGEVVLDNSNFLSTAGCIANATRGGRGVLRVIDSSLNWSGNADTVLLSAAGPNSWTASQLYVQVDDDSVFPTDFSVTVAGDCIKSTRGWNDDVLTYDSNSVMYLDIDQVVNVKMDCTATVTCSFSMVGVNDVFSCTGNIIFVEDGEYVYTGLQEDGSLYNPNLAEVADNGDGTANVTYTMSNGSTMTYLSLPYNG